MEKNMISYADDTALVVGGSELVKKNSDRVNLTLRVIVSWTHSNCLNVNKIKQFTLSLTGKLFP